MWKKIKKLINHTPTMERFWLFVSIAVLITVFSVIPEGTPELLLPVSLLCTIPIIMYLRYRSKNAIYREAQSMLAPLVEPYDPHLELDLEVKHEVRLQIDDPESIKNALLETQHIAQRWLSNLGVFVHLRNDHVPLLDYARELISIIDTLKTQRICTLTNLSLINQFLENYPKEIFELKQAIRQIEIENTNVSENITKLLKLLSEQSSPYARHFLNIVGQRRAIVNLAPEFSVNRYLEFAEEPRALNPIREFTNTDQIFTGIGRLPLAIKQVEARYEFFTEKRRFSLFMAGTNPRLLNDGESNPLYKFLVTDPISDINITNTINSFFKPTAQIHFIEEPTIEPKLTPN